MNLINIRALILVPLLSGLLHADGLHEQEYFGRVTQVLAGDRLQVHNGRRRDTIRIYGVACVQGSMGEQARHFTRDLAGSRGVHVCIVKPAKHGQRVARVNFIGGRSLSEELVSSGMARWDRTTAPEDKKLATLEAEARTARRGIWATKS